MTYLLSIDPGKSSGIALGFYGPTTPYELVARWAVLGGVEGFRDWWKEERFMIQRVNEIVLEVFVLADNDFKADLTPVKIEGALAVLAEGIPIIEQDRTYKGRLTGYPAEAVTKAQRQRVRFDWLQKRGLFLKGSAHDDENDACTHALVSLKLRRHQPTVRKYWPPRERLMLAA